MGIFLDWVAAASANAVTSGMLHPMDVAKTHLQITEIITTGNTTRTVSERASTSKTLLRLYRDRGLVGVYAPGLKATMLREMSSSGVRAGFYISVRDKMDEVIGKDVDAPLIKKVMAAMSTGWLSAILSNPIDVVKIRMISDGSNQRYAGVTAAFRDIVNAEGMKALGKGMSASVLRGTFISAGEMASYDHSKTILMYYLGGERGDRHIHIGASLIAGLVSTTVAAPFDVLKTRGMNSTISIGPWTILLQAIRKEGLGVLMRGWVPAYCRLGPHAMICFPIMEFIRNLLGLDAI
jgi:solute carrier family 25 (mitochondrial dicarboxylate transporter), member 10